MIIRSLQHSVLCQKGSGRNVLTTSALLTGISAGGSGRKRLGIFSDRLLCNLHLVPTGSGCAAGFPSAYLVGLQREDTEGDWPKLLTFTLRCGKKGSFYF